MNPSSIMLEELELLKRTVSFIAADAGHRRRLGETLADQLDAVLDAGFSTRRRSRGPRR
jgi:hypothetical protein